MICKLLSIYMLTILSITTVIVAAMALSEWQHNRSKK